MWILVWTFAVVVFVPTVFDLLYIVGPKLKCGHPTGIEAIDDTLWLLDRFIFFNAWVWVFIFVAKNEKNKEDTFEEGKQREVNGSGVSSSTQSVRLDDECFFS